MTVGQGPIVLAVGAGGGCLDIFTLIYPFSPLSPSLRETARYRLKYCLKGPLNPEQPTNQSLFVLSVFPRDVLDKILDLIESVSEGYPTCSNIILVYRCIFRQKNVELNAYETKISLYYYMGIIKCTSCSLVGWLVLGLTAL